MTKFFRYIYHIGCYFGGESGIPVPGKLFPNRGEVGGRTNDAWPAAVGESGMPDREVGKADRVGEDISGFIPECIQKYG